MKVESREKVDRRNQNIFSPADDDQEIKIDIKKNSETKANK